MTQRQSRALSYGSEEAHDRQAFLYPRVPTLLPPPPVHSYPQRYPDVEQTEGPRAQSSVSSDSGTSSTSYRKQQTSSSDVHWPSPTLERTLVDNYNDQHCPGHSVQSVQWRQASLGRAGYSPRRSEMVETTPPTLAYTNQRRHYEEDYEEEENNNHALWVLLWLSCLDPIHSLASCVFTLIVAFGLMLATPIRVFRKQSSFGDQLVRTVAPIFKNHLDMMYAASVEQAFEWEFRPAMLFLIHFSLPLISIGIAVSSWITGTFWVFTFIMGNPDGTERRDDGADAVLAVRNWWENCLLLAVRPRVQQSVRSIV